MQLSTTYFNALKKFARAIGGEARHRGAARLLKTKWLKIDDRKMYYVYILHSLKDGQTLGLLDCDKSHLL